ncbi:hypothetical protein HANVADRAFT_3425 [Hanseniaspora valbyensis NRRL Y-1626]|uniref:Uncharacterized protein n=1 Tax=Hanseniaspora valbyensis NRRL Y-1626 TaxID=766949 RepID=A0A1B7TAQ1_9ASCO|nr:hypothetical protein HANVADRAFT_3425 [Hanseniaspora valbyensis NRRL Y-1626]
MAKHEFKKCWEDESVSNNNTDELEVFEKLFIKDSVSKELICVGRNFKLYTLSSELKQTIKLFISDFTGIVCHCEIWNKNAQQSFSSSDCVVFLGLCPQKYGRFTHCKLNPSYDSVRDTDDISLVVLKTDNNFISQLSADTAEKEKKTQELDTNGEITDLKDIFAIVVHVFESPITALISIAFFFHLRYVFCIKYIELNINSSKYKCFENNKFVNVDETGNKILIQLAFYLELGETEDSLAIIDQHILGYYEVGAMKKMVEKDP